MSIGLILLVAAVVIGGFIVLTYNKLIAMIEAVKNNNKQIDIQLDRRYKVFESLINVVKKYMDYEQTTLKDVVALRNKAQQAKASGDEKTRIASENQISDIATHIDVVFEQYPQLKANENCKQLQEEIVNTENKLAYAKQSFNDSIETYYANKKAFFTSMVVAMFKTKLDFEFNYWQISDNKITEHENYTVNL